MTGSPGVWGKAVNLGVLSECPGSQTRGQELQREFSPSVHLPFTVKALWTCVRKSPFLFDLYKSPSIGLSEVSLSYSQQPLQRRLTVQPRLTENSFGGPAALGLCQNLGQTE